MKLTNRQKWLRTIVWMKREFPGQRPVTVESCKVDKEFLGSAELAGGRFKIEIGNKLCIRVKLEVLIHEWAHIISWFGAGHVEDHPDDWGLAYAKIYRAFIDWEYGE